MRWRLRSRRLSRLRRKPSLQLKVLTERNKLHTTKKAGQRAARVVRERNTSRKWKLNSRRSVMTSSLSWTKTQPISQTEYRSRRTSTKDAQEVIQFGQVDFEQVAEKRQACDVEAEWCIQEHAAQREVVAVEQQQKLVKKSLEIQIEEKHVAGRGKEQGSHGEELT